jgi:hypothetical protein
MKYWEIIADNLSKAGLQLGLRLRPLIPAGEQSGLQTRTATTKASRRAGGRKADGVYGIGIRA